MFGRKKYRASVAISAIGQSQCRQGGGGGGAVGVPLSPGGGELGCLLIGHSYVLAGAIWSSAGALSWAWCTQRHNMCISQTLRGSLAIRRTLLAASAGQAAASSAGSAMT